MSTPETIGPRRPAHTRSSLVFLWWLIASQKLRIAAGATVGTLWMVGLALPPYLLARVFDSSTFLSGRLHEQGAVLLMMAGVTNVLAVSSALDLRKRKETAR